MMLFQLHCVTGVGSTSNVQSTLVVLQKIYFVLEIGYCVPFCIIGEDNFHYPPRANQTSGSQQSPGLIAVGAAYQIPVQPLHHSHPLSFTAPLFVQLATQPLELREMFYSKKVSPGPLYFQDIIIRCRRSQTAVKY